MQRYPAFVHGQGRIRTPLRRTGRRGEGRFERITWPEALDLVHERFTQVITKHRPQAIVPLNYSGPHGFLAGGSINLRFFHRLGASLLNRKPLCGGTRTEAWVGTFGPVPKPPEQAAHARLIVAWGNNVTWSNLHFTSVINQAKRAAPDSSSWTRSARRSPSRRTFTSQCARGRTSSWRGPSRRSSSDRAAWIAPSWTGTSRASRRS